MEILEKLPSGTLDMKLLLQEVFLVRHLILLGEVALYHHLIQEEAIETTLLILEKTGKNRILIEKEHQTEVNLREEIVYLMVDKYRS
jgi:hypothetical protein